MSNLITHAQRELELCGQYKEDPAFAVAVLAAVSAFAAYPGHSGGSAMAGAEMLSDLLNFKNLSPLTNDPDEWVEHPALMWNGQNKVWQNKRNGSAFSEDGGITYTLVDDPEKNNVHHSKITHANDGSPLLFARFLPTEESVAMTPVDPEPDYGNEPDDDDGGEAEPVRMRRVPNGSGYDEVPVKEEGN